MSHFDRLSRVPQGQDKIAKELFISPKTVGTHIQRTLSKLGVHSRTEAVALAYQRGFTRSAQPTRSHR